MDFGVESSDTTTWKKATGTRKTFYIDPSKQYWETELRGMKFSTDTSDEWGFTTTIPARFATGQQCIYAPTVYYDLFKRSIMKNSLGYYEDPTYGFVVDCNQEDDMNDIDILLGPLNDGDVDPTNDTYLWTKVRVSDYLIQIESSYQCQVCIRETQDDAWYLGASWFAGYYVEFDADSTTPLVTVTQAENGGKTAWPTEVAVGDLPSRVFGTNTTTVALLGSGIGLCWILLITMVIMANCYLLFFAKKKGSNSKKANNSAIANQIDDLLKQN